MFTDRVRPSAYCQLVYQRYSIAPYMPYWTNKRYKVACYCPARSCCRYYKSSNGLLICCKLFYPQSPHQNPKQPNANGSGEHNAVVTIHPGFRGS
ncbi:hypothetical protein EST62_00285 [Chlorobaculum sp. 24CR]|nr:hypothetical protein EST62_00285 [Chlorobaculum sp. 24CR]